MDRLPKKNLTAKIIALIMAIVLWVYVMNEQNPPVEISMDIPLEVRNLSNSVMAVDIPDAVRVKVRGPRTLIVGLSQKDIKSYIDLKGLSDGRNTAKVNTAIPASLELVEVSPEKINFRLDTIASRQVPVEAKIIGTLPSGAAVGKITYSLPTVTVKGPSELLSTVVKAIADVDVSGQAADFTLNAPLSLVDENGKKVEGLSITPGNVSISLAVVPIVNKKLVDIKPNIIGILPKGIRLNQISINPEQVEISGDAKILEKIDFLYTEPVNITGIDKDTAIEVKLQFKEGVVSSKNTVIVNISTAKQ
ncbi:MAG: YbbR family protein [Firmicutes bacterium]|nr:YbbR family protein [Bacillota bacterium]